MKENFKGKKKLIWGDTKLFVLAIYLRTDDWLFTVSIFVR